MKHDHLYLGIERDEAIKLRQICKPVAHQHESGTFWAVEYVDGTNRLFDPIRLYEVGGRGALEFKFCMAPYLRDRWLQHSASLVEIEIPQLFWRSLAYVIEERKLIPGFEVLEEIYKAGLDDGRTQIKRELDSLLRL